MLVDVSFVCTRVEVPSRGKGWAVRYLASSVDTAVLITAKYGLTDCGQWFKMHCRSGSWKFCVLIWCSIWRRGGTHAMVRKLEMQCAGVFEVCPRVEYVYELFCQRSCSDTDDDIYPAFISRGRKKSGTNIRATGYLQYCCHITSSTSYWTMSPTRQRLDIVAFTPSRSITPYIAIHCIEMARGMF